MSANEEWMGQDTWVSLSKRIGSPGFSQMVIEPGSFIVPYPFVRVRFIEFHDGPVERLTWRPGIAMVQFAPDDAEPVANAMGEMVLTEISRHKPGRFPERVFFTRKWRDPDGNVFGKSNLHIAITSKFKRLCSGYAHPFRLDDREIKDGVFAEDFPKEPPMTNTDCAQGGEA